MKAITLILSILFLALTFAGSLYVLLHGGTINAGYACVPMVLALIFMTLYRKYK